MTNARFLLSTLSEFPILKDPRGNVFPEIAFAGRSNVGKSSLINHLFGQKKLAKTSATPGKTQLLNFFSIDEKFILADLPGYGFAKAPVDEVEKWSKAIDHYLNTRKSLRLIFLLIDCRRNFNAEDFLMIDWAAKKGIPLWVIFTKTDKLTAAQLKDELQKAKAATSLEIFSYSTKETRCRTFLMKRIQEFLWD